MEGSASQTATTDRPSGKKRARTRWGPNKDDARPVQPGAHTTDGAEQPSPASQAVSPQIDEQSDTVAKRKRTRWGQGDGSSPSQPIPSSHADAARKVNSTVEQGAAALQPPLPTPPRALNGRSTPAAVSTSELRHGRAGVGGGAAAGVLPQEMAELQKAYQAFRQELVEVVGGGGSKQGAEVGRTGHAAPNRAPAAPPPSESPCSLYVGNVAPHITEEALSALFGSVVGQSLERCWLSPDPATPFQHRGHGLVRVKDGEAADRATQLLHDYPLGGQKLIVRPRGSMDVQMPPSAQSDHGPSAAFQSWPAMSQPQPPSGLAGGGDGAAAGYNYFATGYDSYAAYYAAAAAAAAAYPGGAYPGYGAAPAAPTTPAPPSDRPPGTEDDPAYDYAYPAPNAPEATPAGPEAGMPAHGAAGGLPGVAHLAAAVKAEVERREEEGLLPPGVDHPEEHAAGQRHPQHLFGAPAAEQPDASAVAQHAAYAGYDPSGYAGYEQYGAYYDPATGMFYDYTGADGHAALEGGVSGAAAQQAQQQQGASQPNLEPPRIKPRVPRSRRKKGGEAGGGDGAAQPIEVPLPAGWEEKQRSKMEEAAAKMAAAAAARAEAAAQGPPRQSSAAARAASAVAAAAAAIKQMRGRSRSPLPRPPSPRPAPQDPHPSRSPSRSRSPLRYSTSPSPRRHYSTSPSRGRSFSRSRSPPPHRRFPSGSLSPRYHSRSPSPPSRGYQGRGGFRGRGRGRGRGGYGRGGYTPAPRGRRYSLSPPPRSRSPSYDDYRRNRGSFSRSPSPDPHRDFSGSPRGRWQRGSRSPPPPRGSRSPPPSASPPSSPEEGELEEGELEMDPREARRLQRQQERQQQERGARPGPPPPPRGGYGGGRGRPPPLPYTGGRGRGGRGPPPPPDYAGEYDYVSGQAVPLVNVMPMAGMMGMMPMAGMMGVLPMGVPPGGGRGAGAGRGPRGRY